MPRGKLELTRVGKNERPATDALLRLTSPLMQGQIRPNPTTPSLLCLPSSIVCLPLLSVVLTFAFWLLTFDLTPPAASLRPQVLT
jgi:hypothetical protein